MSDAIRAMAEQAARETPCRYVTREEFLAVVDTIARVATEHARQAVEDERVVMREVLADMREVHAMNLKHADGYMRDSLEDWIEQLSKVTVQA